MTVGDSDFLEAAGSVADAGLKRRLKRVILSPLAPSIDEAVEPVLLPSLARLRHVDRPWACLFTGADRKWSASVQNDAIDPELPSSTAAFCDAPFIPQGNYVALPSTTSASNN